MKARKGCKMRTIEITEDRKIIFDGQATNISWTKEAEDDLKIFHGLNIQFEVAVAVMQEIDAQFNLTEEEKSAVKFALAEAMT